MTHSRPVPREHWIFALTGLVLLGLTAAPAARAQPRPPAPAEKFRQLGEMLPSGSDYRTASGSPGRSYWQQRVDYVIDVELDEAKRRIVGRETVTYKNNSPDSLTYLWLDLDQNVFRKDSDANLSQTAPRLALPAPPPAGAPIPGAPRSGPRLSYDALDTLLESSTFEGGFNIKAVTDAKGAPLPHRVVRTMMRIDLKEPLPPQGAFTFNVGWDYNINHGLKINVRTGYEPFPKDGNDIFEIAQWFPRLAPYTDVNGWQQTEYMGAGEFALEFGDYLVRITAPDDHIVAASGILQNPEQTLSQAQRARLARARTADRPVLIVTPEEARTAERRRSVARKTWIFKADNVRDFAFASSRKFIWDAQGYARDGINVLAMSLYPNEANPLWGQYSTAAVVHTLKVYSRYSFPYPYPVAISVNGSEEGMEYPMISFTGRRPDEDGTYPARRKYSMISTVIHEVGHNYFPMVVNSDERRWAWMDEGLNAFIEYLAEMEWEKGYPTTRGMPSSIAAYMATDGQDSIMTSPDLSRSLGATAYNKPATGLTILRETILGRDLFDHAFKEYARRWKFKHPEPADFFRTMEDASGIDLDWFWRGWFYGTDHVDQTIDSVKLFTVDTRDPDVEKALQRKDHDQKPLPLPEQRDAARPHAVDAEPELKDFYNHYDPLDVTEADGKAYADLVARLDPHEKELLGTSKNFYVVGIKNLGGLVMPVILKVDYADGTSEELRLPAEIWRYNASSVEKLIITPREISRITVDPQGELPDTDLSN
ncbi:MAG: M1 family metallopeptidase, partial [Vicinamibacteria bacterium]